MSVLTYVAIIAHFCVLYRGYFYFWDQQDFRHCDRHLVAGAMACSGLYLLSLVPVWVAVVPGVATVVTPMGAAFAIANAMFYMVLIHLFHEERGNRRAAHG